jgi:hypothetical protein
VTKPKQEARGFASEQTQDDPKDDLNACIGVWELFWILPCCFVASIGATSLAWQVLNSASGLDS